MKKLIQTSLCLLLAAGSLQGLKAQGIKLPQPSSGQTVIQDFGLGQITLKYSRPNIHGRQVFAALVPYGEVWRTGANNATVISFTEDVQLEGKPVPAGEYALFTIPGETAWTIILNKTTKQWGAYSYKQADDFLRFSVKPQEKQDKAETFSIRFEDVNPTSATMELCWDKTVVPVHLTTDIDAKVMAGIQEAMKGEKKPYMAAAQYYLENGKDLNQALEWMNAAEAADPKGPWIKLWKGRIQLKMGDKKGAAATARAGITLAAADHNEEYVRLNTALLDSAK